MRKPYFEQDGIQIYHGDCWELLPEMSMDEMAVVTDPPYGIGLNTRYGKRGGAHPMGASEMPRVRGDDLPFDPRPFLGFPRVLLWGANHFHQWLRPGGQFLVWDKRCSLVPSRTQGDSEMAWINRPGPLRTFYHLWDGFLKASERNEKRVHPTQKPVRLMAWCIGFFPEVSTVIDPYMGSGSTLLAARELGVKAIGIEIDESYCEIAAQRLEVPKVGRNP